MKVSLNWAQEYSNVNLSSASMDDVVDAIGRQLGEVETVENWGARYDGIVVAKVVESRKHSNADKLSVCLVDDGGVVDDVARDSTGYVQVVCGAPNVRAGMIVAWLPPGSTVPSTLNKDPFVLEARDFRGEMSNGMLASARELGLSDEHDGILEILPSEVGEKLATPGTPFKQLFSLDDIVIDIENKMFTHRPDCFGILGVAREIAGIQNKAFVSPEWYIKPRPLHGVSTTQLTARVEDRQNVPRFMAVTLGNVSVAPSPTWLQAGLARVGIKSINNVVDITNFVMHLTGQPLHAYDAQKIAERSTSEPTLVARQSRDGDQVTLLNGKTIKPEAPTIVIATDKEVVGLGGVMGGADTEVDAQTTSIILECATFNMYNIRRTSMKYGLFTDAVTRYNKGQSPLQNDRVIAYAVSLLEDMTGAHQTSDCVDIHDNLPTQNTVTVTPEFVNDRLGTSLTGKDMAQLLTNVEFDVNVGESLQVTAPFWRTDISQPEDIVEEIGRLYGYDNVPLQLPTRNAQPARRDPLLAIKSTLRDILSAGGANELLTYSFVHGKLIEAAGQSLDLAYGLSNAISPELQYYRLSLTPSLLEKVHPNIKSGYDAFALFEMNKVHVKNNGTDADGTPNEIHALALTFAASNKQTSTFPGAAYYQARNYLDLLANKLGWDISYQLLTQVPDYQFAKPFVPTRSALVRDNRTDQPLGIVGEYHDRISKALKLPTLSAGFEISLDVLLETADLGKKYQPLSRFPWSSQDISFAVPADISYGQLNTLTKTYLQEQSIIKGCRAKVSPLDIYQPADSPDKKHMSLHIRLSHPDRTLTTNEVNNLLDELATGVENEFGAQRL